MREMCPGSRRLLRADTVAFTRVKRERVSGGTDEQPPEAPEQPRRAGWSPCVGCTHLIGLLGGSGGLCPDPQKALKPPGADFSTGNRTIEEDGNPGLVSKVH